MILKEFIASLKAPKNIFIEFIILIISYVTIFNFMYLENMYFVECAVMALSLLFYLLAAKTLVQKEDKYILKTILFMILGIISYQGTIGIFLAFVLVFSILKNKGEYKIIFLDLIKSGLIALFAVLVNILIVTIIGFIFHTNQTRLNGISSIFIHIGYILSNTWVILSNTCSLFPKYLFIIFTLLIFGTFAVYCIRKKEYKNIGELAVIILFTIITAFIVYLITLTSYYTGRLRFSIGATVGIMFIYLYCSTDIFENRNIFNYLITGILSAYFIFNIYNYVSIMYQHKKVNEMEKQEASTISEYIDKYEKNNSIKIDKIAIFIVPKNTNKTYYEGIKNKAVVTYSALKSDWSIIGALKFYTKKEFEVIKPDKILQRSYERKINDNDYICINDTLCINAYMY